MPDSQPQPPHSVGLLRLVRPGGRRPRSCSAAPGSPTAGPSTYGWAAGASRPSARPAASTRRARRRRVDLGGYLLLPAPAEPHAHGDTALYGRRGGPASRTTPRTSSAGPRRPRCSSSGTARPRCAPTCASATSRGSAPLEAVLQARRSLRGLADLTAVAVPRLLTGVAGADGLAMLRDAVKMGASRGRRLPRPRPRPDGLRRRRSWRSPPSTAARSTCTRTVTTRPGSARLAAMAGGLRPGRRRSARARGLARLPADEAARDRRPARRGRRDGGLPAAGRLRRAPGRRGTGSRTAAARGRGAGGRGQRGAAGRAPTRWAAATPWRRPTCWPRRTGCAPEDAYDAVSSAARAAMGLPEVRVEAGFPAELLAVRGDRLAGALSLAYSRIVVHRGRVVARTSAVREYCDSAAAVGARPLRRRRRRAEGREPIPARAVRAGLERRARRRAAYGRRHAHCHRWWTWSDRAAAGAAARRAR